MKFVLLTATLITVVLVNCRVKAKPQNETKATSRSLWKGKQFFLEWHFVDGGDYFVRLDERMTWDFAQQSCNNIGLQLYEPRNSMNVARYLAKENDIDESWNESWTYKKNYFLGGRGTGNNMCWLSGEVVSKDEPMDPKQYKDVGTDDCLYLSTHSYNVNRNTVLRAGSGQCIRLDFMPRVLCGESRAYTLEWHYVGGEKFARYHHLMDWEDSRALCKTFGLDLFQPKNVPAVAQYLWNLKDASGDLVDFHWTAYWLGGHRVPNYGNVLAGWEGYIKL